VSSPRCCKTTRRVQSSDTDKSCIQDILLFDFCNYGVQRFTTYITIWYLSFKDGIKDNKMSILRYGQIEKEARPWNRYRFRL